MTTTTAVANEVKALKVGPTTLAEEKAAAKLEEKRPTAAISPANFKRVNRVHELKAKKDEIDTEIDLHKSFIYKEMDRKGVDVLTKRNVEVVSRDNYTTVTVDWKALERDFPEVAHLYIKKSTNKRVNWKKLFGGIFGK
jgi:hypothetical protein